MLFTYYTFILDFSLLANSCFFSVNITALDRNMFPCIITFSFTSKSSMKNGHVQKAIHIHKE